MAASEWFVWANHWPERAVAIPPDAAPPNRPYPAASEFYRIPPVTTPALPELIPVSRSCITTYEHP